MVNSVLFAVAVGAIASQAVAGTVHHRRHEAVHHRRDMEGYEKHIDNSYTPSNQTYDPFCTPVCTTYVTTYLGEPTRKYKTFNNHDSSTQASEPNDKYS